MQRVYSVSTDVKECKSGPAEKIICTHIHLVKANATRLKIKITAIVRKLAIAVDAFLLFVYAFLVPTPVVGQPATQLNVIPANTVTGRSAVSEDGPTSSPRLNTNIVTGTSAVTEDDPTSSTCLNTTELSPVTVIDEPTLESLPAYRASVQLKRFYLPFVIVAGTFGNVGCGCDSLPLTSQPKVQHVRVLHSSGHFQHHNIVDGVV